jgi:hypothetical protein
MAMHVRLRKSLAVASLFALAAAAPAVSPALAQSWVDPPATAENPSGASGQASVAAPEPKPASPPPAAEPAAPPKAQAAQQPAEAPRETLRFDAPRETAPNRAAPPSRTAAPANAEPKATAPRRAAQSGASAPPETPPTRSVRRPRPAPALAARPQSRERQTGSMAGAAQQLAIDHLGYWSGPNAVAVGSTPDFYAPRVLFHGRSMSARALAEEKRRFVQRWPQRYYTPRLETMRTSCDPARDICTVRTVFDFTALNPAQGARSRGTADLELGVSFSGGRPVIAFESSHVLRRGRSARSASLDDAE